MKKIFTSMALLLCASVSSVWAGDTFTVSLNNGATQTRSDGGSGDYFTVTSGGGYNSNYTGTYNGTTYTKGLKINSKSSVTFTTAATSTLTYVQSLSNNSTNATALKNSSGTELISATTNRVDDTSNKVGVYTYENLPAGTYTIYSGKNNKETGLLYVSVEYTGAVLTQLSAPEFEVNTETGEVTISYSAVAQYAVYTTDGSDPSASNGTKIENPSTTITVEDGTTVKAIAIGDQEEYSNSAVSSTTVYLDNVTIADPTITSSNGVVAMSCETTGTTIYYTTDGSEPSSSSTEYTGTFYLSENKTVKAIAARGDNASNTTSEDVTGMAVASKVLLTGSNDAFKGANEVSFTVDGNTYTLKCGNSSKEYSASGNVYVDGAKQTGIKLSNGASNTLTLPDGLVATKITLYSVINAASTGARTCGWKEVSGISDTEYKSYPMGAFNDLTSTNQTDIRTYELDNLSEIVFTNTGEQLMFVIALDVEEKSTEAEINGTDISKKYTTYACDQTLDFTNANVSAFIAAYNDEDGDVTLTKKEIVPAETPVVIYAEELSDDGSDGKTLTVSGVVVSTGTADVSANQLVRGAGSGISYEAGNDKYNYVLTDGAFHPVTDGTVVGTSRAYLQIAYDVEGTSAKAINIVIAGEEATGISEVKTAANNGKIYNLQGIEVKNADKGLFIINGKKVIK